MRRWLRGTAVVIVAVLALALLAAWWLGREGTLRWVAAQVVAASDGRLQIEDARGSLYGPLRIARLRFENDTLVVDAVAIELDWRPRALWRRSLVVDTLTVGTLTLVQKAGGAQESQGATRTLRLPLSVSLPQARVDQLRIDAAGRRYAFTAVTGQAQAQGETVSASVQANDGALQAQGEVSLAPGYAHTLAATLAGLDLARISALPPSDLHGRVLVRGRVSPPTLPWSGRVEATLAPSTFNRERVQGRAAAAVDGRVLSEVDVDVALGRNRLQAQGGFGTPKARLTWALAAPRLADLGPGFGGRIDASGTAAGDYAAPQLRFEVDAHALRLPGDHRITRVQGRGTVAAAPAATVDARLRMSGYRRDALRVAQADLALQGTPADHRLTFSARGDELDARAQARGAWREGVWRGEITELAERLRLRTHLVGRARLEVARERLRLADATLAVARGRVVITRLERQGAVWHSEGQAQELALSALLRYWPRSIPAQTTLVLAGDWKLDVGETLNGHVNVQRVRGDITVPGATPWTLGLTRMQVRASAENGLARLTGDLAGARTGEIGANLQTRVTRRDGRFGVTADAPLTVDATAAVPSLAWLNAFSDKASVDGRLQARVRGRGTIGAPQWDGEIRGEALAFSVPAQGLHWRDGDLQAQLRGEELVLTRLRLNGGDGHVQASGTAGLLARRADIAVAVRSLLVSRLPTRELEASGDGQVTLRGQELRVQGKFGLDRGRVTLAERSAPTLSSDIVIVGEEEEEAAQAARRATALRPQLDVEIGLGDRFFLQGSGLDARLTGAVVLQVGQEGIPRARGSIRTAEGTYAAYGQRLSLERGVLTFNGPVDNPALDILALRKNQEVQAGVAVTGTALQPVVKLVSIPPVPDADKLSWLVLGHGIDDSSSAEADVLAQAAAALLARGESVTLQARIAQRTGLDEFRFSGGGGLEGAIVTLGKRLSSRVYVTYQAGLSGTTDLFTARYTLSPRWSLETRRGGEATAVDLFYTFSFD